MVNAVKAVTIYAAFDIVREQTGQLFQWKFSNKQSKTSCHY